MDINIEKIIDSYIDKMNKYIDDGNKNKKFSSEELESIANNCIKDTVNYLEPRYNIKNYQYKNDLLKLRALKYIYDELGFRHSKLMFKEIEGTSYKSDVKSRLFMIILKTLDEIIYLLEGGYSTGATARMRCLYESCVFLEIVQKNNENFAKQYFIESSKSQYRIASELGLVNVQKNIKRYIKGKVNVNKFFNTYNWAKNYIGKSEPSFYDLAKVSRYKNLYVSYISSCHYVHSDLYGSICAIDKSKDEDCNIWYSDPSSYGSKKTLYEVSNIFNLCIWDYFDKTDSSITCLALGILKANINFKM